ncbi:hypothetical protein [Glycomyces sp. NPDC048151]|uniref:hypothetical protein n=1 Tax=Glycomyces sp. NPDC048151 TaxID=3364002 RepID=UPI00371BFA37
MSALGHEVQVAENLVRLLGGWAVGIDPTSGHYEGMPSYNHQRTPYEPDSLRVFRVTQGSVTPSSRGSVRRFLERTADKVHARIKGAQTERQELRGAEGQLAPCTSSAFPKSSKRSSNAPQRIANDSSKKRTHGPLSRQHMKLTWPAPEQKRENASTPASSNAKHSPWSGGGS